MTVERGGYQPFQVMDELDTQLVKDYLAAEANEYPPLVFAVEENGKLYCELNWEGVKAALAVCAQRGVASIAVAQLPPQFHETAEYVQYTVLAVDTISGRSNWGVAREYKRDNPFAMQIALTKAQRNAMRNLIPAEIRRELIRESAEAGRIEAVSLAPQAEKKATERQLAKIKTEIEAKDVDVEKMLAYYGVQALEELSCEQASNAIKLLGLRKPRGDGGSRG